MTTQKREHINDAAFSSGIYLSELLPKEDIGRFLHETGAGLELIRFSVSENLDHFFETMAAAVPPERKKKREQAV